MAEWSVVVRHCACSVIFSFSELKPSSYQAECLYLAMGNVIAQSIHNIYSLNRVSFCPFSMLPNVAVVS